ncbi:MAG TPA: hypothetical protein VMD47_11780 [Candidatus Acidoferrales bacterium]|nr:hypothetical protein [Candidatus Acidoferrales bacterium]
MAIRPADLQLAYLAAPQNAAQVNSAQEAPQNAQAAAQATFAAQVQQREEVVKQAEHAERTAVRTNPDGGNGGGYTPQQRRRQPHQEQEAPAQDSSLGLTGEGEHFIDFTA